MSAMCLLLSMACVGLGMCLLESYGESGGAQISHDAWMRSMVLLEEKLDQLPLWQFVVLLAIIMLMPLGLARQRATAEKSALTDMQMAQSAQYQKDKLVFLQLGQDLERQGKWSEATRMYLKVNEPELAINMYEKREEYQKMLRLMSKYRKDLFYDTCKHIAEQHEMKGNFKDAEYYYVEAKLWTNAMRMHQQMAKHGSHAKVAETSCLSGICSFVLRILSIRMPRSWKANQWPRDQTDGLPSILEEPEEAELIGVELKHWGTLLQKPCSKQTVFQERKDTDALSVQDAPFQEPVHLLIQNMDPEALRLVLCWSFFCFLPGPLRLLMLPSKELGKQVLTGDDISNLDFLHRNQKKQEKIKYPELMPLVTSTLSLQLASPMTAYGPCFFRWLQLGVFTTGLPSFFAAGLLCHDNGRRALENVASSLLQRSVALDARGTKAAAAMSLFGAGGAIAVSIFSERCRRHFDELQGK